MLFNSYIFVLVFLPIVLIGYFSLTRCNKDDWAKVFLIGASFIFYGFYRWSYLFVIISSILVNYTLSQWMLKEERPARRRFAFFLGLLFNLGSLFYFKYVDFFLSNCNWLLNCNWEMLHIALPLGISFFTFQQLSYVIDSYQRVPGITGYRFKDYALFVTYFPQLIAGPIVTHDEMVPQFADKARKHFSIDNFACGLYGFTLGLAKKVILADSFGRAVNTAFQDISGLSCTTSLFVMLAYTLQIYYDFSGYCDMAVGIGRMMNIDITINFNTPYRATSISDFWKRWHITLTRFFTRYVYIPLGGNRKGMSRTYANILIVFLVSGLWHGANWTFVLWGGLNGVALAITRFLDTAFGNSFSKGKTRLGIFIRWSVTFILINLLWVLFRADSLQEAMTFYRNLFNFHVWKPDIILVGSICPSFFKPLIHLRPQAASAFALIFLAAGVVFSVIGKNTQERMAAFRPTLANCLVTALLLAYCILSFAGVSSFLYWNF